MKPPILDVDEAGMSMVPYARSRLLQLEQRRKSSGVPFLYSRELDDGTTTIDITASAVSPKIRIRSGAGPEHIVLYGPAAYPGRIAAATTNIKGKLLYSTLLPAGVTPHGVAISADGSIQYAVYTDAPAADSFYTGTLTVSLLRIRGEGLTDVFSCLYTPPAGWEWIVSWGFSMTPFAGGFSHSGIAVADNKCLFPLGLAQNPNERRGYPAFYRSGSDVLGRPQRGLVCYFDGSELTVQQTTWEPSAPVYTGSYIGNPPGLFSLSVARDCSKWAAVINGGERQEPFSIREEVHTAATGGVTVREYGAPYDPTVLASAALSSAFFTSYGFIDFDGVVKTTYANTYYTAVGPTTSFTEKAAYDGVEKYSSTDPNTRLYAFSGSRLQATPHVFSATQTAGPALTEQVLFVDGVEIERVTNPSSVLLVHGVSVGARYLAVYSNYTGGDITIGAGITTPRVTAPYAFGYGGGFNGDLRISSTGVLYYSEPHADIIAPPTRSESGEVVSYSAGNATSHYRRDSNFPASYYVNFGVAPSFDSRRRRTPVI